jgi:hypothetical protein
MDGGIQISTANGIAAIVFLVGAVGSLLKIIRDQYAARLSDRDQTIADQKERIRKLEEDVKDRNEALKLSVAALDRASDIIERTTAATEEVVRQVPAAATRRRGA